MKNVLLILAAFGLAACNEGSVPASPVVTETVDGRYSAAQRFMLSSSTPLMVCTQPTPLMLSNGEKVVSTVCQMVIDGKQYGGVMMMQEQ